MDKKELYARQYSLAKNKLNNLTEGGLPARKLETYPPPLKFIPSNGKEVSVPEDKPSLRLVTPETPETPKTPAKPASTPETPKLKITTPEVFPEKSPVAPEKVPAAAPEKPSAPGTSSKIGIGKAAGVGIQALNPVQAAIEALAARLFGALGGAAAGGLFINQTAGVGSVPYEVYRSPEELAPQYPGLENLPKADLSGGYSRQYPTLSPTDRLEMALTPEFPYPAKPVPVTPVTPAKPSVPVAPPVPSPAKPSVPVAPPAPVTPPAVRPIPVPVSPPAPLPIPLPVPIPAKPEGGPPEGTTDETDEKRQKNKDEPKKEKPISRIEADVMRTQLGMFDPGEVSGYSKSVQRGREQQDPSERFRNPWLLTPRFASIGRSMTVDSRGRIVEANDLSLKVKRAVSDYLKSKHGKELKNHLDNISKQLEK